MKSKKPIPSEKIFRAEDRHFCENYLSTIEEFCAVYVRTAAVGNDSKKISLAAPN